MARFYYWDEKTSEVVETESELFPDVYVVDTHYEGAHMRYGIFDMHSNWDSREFSTFPNEFKLQLLLLGVT